jgi:hypothetical protein
MSWFSCTEQRDCLANRRPQSTEIIMQQIHLSAEEQKFVNRWRLFVACFYSSIAIITILLVAFESVKDQGSLEARMNPTVRPQPMNANR